MIGYVSGEIIATSEEKVTLATNSGVGYEIFIGEDKAVKYQQDDSAEFFTYTKLGENDLRLYGFENKHEKQFFKKLTSTSGVGPKSAMNIITVDSLANLKQAIQEGDKELLSEAKGIGKKTASKILVQLESEVEVTQAESDKSGEEQEKINELISALTSMGYSKSKASQAIKAIDLNHQDKTVQDMLKEVLKQM
jgi:Holliday junction DNA helicase RuvA